MPKPPISPRLTRNSGGLGGLTRTIFTEWAPSSSSRERALRERKCIPTPALALTGHTHYARGEQRAAAPAGSSSEIPTIRDQGPHWICSAFVRLKCDDVHRLVPGSRYHSW